MNPPDLLPGLAEPSTDSWRVEVNFRGRFYNFRRGSGKERRGRYGGKFGELPEERKAAYERNKKSKARVKSDLTR